MRTLRDYFEDNLDWLEIVEVKTENNGFDYCIKIDGTYSFEGKEGMLEYHRDELKRVLLTEGLLK